MSRSPKWYFPLCFPSAISSAYGGSSCVLHALTVSHLIYTIRLFIEGRELACLDRFPLNLHNKAIYWRARTVNSSAWKYLQPLVTSPLLDRNIPPAPFSRTVCTCTSSNVTKILYRLAVVVPEMLLYGRSDIKIMVLWDVTPRSLIHSYHRKV